MVPFSQGHLYPFQSHPIYSCYALSHDICLGEALPAPRILAGEKLLGADHVSVYRVVLEQLFGSYAQESLNVF